MEQEQIKKLRCGLISTPFVDALHMMPEIKQILLDAPRDETESYYVDAKVHMLMPGQYPCIPNWHYDFTPRDGDGNKMPECRDPSKKMFLWLSGAPLTLFEDGRVVTPRKWMEFTQFDAHRGVVSDAFQWRLFIRLAPESLIPFKCKGEQCLRRHTQVYLDASKFEW